MAVYASLRSTRFRNVGEVGRSSTRSARPGQHRCRAAVRNGDEAAAVRERVQHRVDAADVVEEEERDRRRGRRRTANFSRMPREVVDGGLALARRAGGEEHQAGMPGRSRGRRRARASALSRQARTCVRSSLSSIEKSSSTCGERRSSSSSAPPAVSGTRRSAARRARGGARSHAARSRPRGHHGSARHGSSSRSSRGLRHAATRREPPMSRRRSRSDGVTSRESVAEDVERNSSRLRRG